MTPKRLAKPVERLLTEAELELMSILWKLGEAAVTEVQGALPRALAYTSVSTILRILEQKGFVSSRKEGRGHLYSPRIAKDRYEESALRHVVSRVFDDEPSSLVRRLVDTQGLSEEDLRSLRALLDERLKKA